VTYDYFVLASEGETDSLNGEFTFYFGLNP